MALGKSGLRAVIVIAIAVAVLGGAWIGLLTIAPSSYWRLDLKWEFHIP